MIKEERINKRSITRRINFNVERLSCSNKTMKDIFNISFSHPEFTLFNVVKDSQVKDITYGEIKSQSKKFANYFAKVIGGKSRYRYFRNVSNKTSIVLFFCGEILEIVFTFKKFRSLHHFFNI